MISFIIPTKDEAENLPIVLTELNSVIGKHIHEIIIIDASADNSVKQIAENFRCTYIKQTDLGYGNAVKKGLANASGKYICFFDADGSYDPQFVIRAISQIENNKYDAVIATRYHKEAGSLDDNFITFIGNFFFTKLMRMLFNLKLTDALHLYLVAKTDISKKLPVTGTHFEYCVEFVVRLTSETKNYIELPAKERKRMFGESKVNAALDGLKILFFMLKLKLSLKHKIDRNSIDSP